MSAYKFSARASYLALDGEYVAHPRSRWHGSRYWLVANSDAVPGRVRTRSKRITTLTPKLLAKAVRPAQEALASNFAMRIVVGPAIDDLCCRTFVRPVEFTGSLSRSLLNLGVNAYFFDWVARHVEGGEWYVELRTGMVFYARSRRVDAVLMPIYMSDSTFAAVHGLGETARAA